MGFSERGLPTDVTLSPVLKELAQELGINTNLITGDGQLTISDGTLERQLLTGFLGLFARTPAKPYIDLQEQTTSLEEIEQREVPWAIGTRSRNNVIYRFEVHSSQGRVDHAFVRELHRGYGNDPQNKEITIAFPGSLYPAGEQHTKAALRTAIAFYGEIKHALIPPTGLIKPVRGGRRS